jgi:uncharacterized protein YndB with AHSA1/START domain
LSTVATEEIEHEILVNARPEVVWEVLTEPEHLAWLGGAQADVDLRPGGTMVLYWEGQGYFLAVIDTVEYPRRLALRWSLVPDCAPAPGSSTVVEFALSPTGTGTKLRVVESGFATLTGEQAERAASLAANRHTWTTGFTALAARAAKLATRTRTRRSR